MNDIVLKEDKYYFCPAPSDTQIPFYIELSGITHPNVNYRIERTANQAHFYVFEFVISGRGYIECDGKTYTVSSGDFYFLNKGHAHKYFSDRDDPYTKIWINAGGTLIDALIKAYSAYDGAYVKHYDAGDIFNEIAFLLRRINISNKNDIYMKAASKICELLIYAFSKSESGGEMRSSTTAEKIKTFIDKGMDFNISLTDIEKHFYLDKSYIIYIFRSEFGITPKQYILKKKVEAAKSLITDPAVCTKEIAEMLNFSSTQHFSSVFKRICGVSPDMYRKEANEAQTSNTQI